MRLLRHELKINRKSFLIWTISIAVFCVGCILLYDSLEESVAQMAESYANMGAMSAAFGMDKLSLATMQGYYGTEIAMIFNLGAAMFAALLGIGMLSKEENGHTAEFLNTLPVSRTRIFFEKYGGIILMLLIFNVIQIALNYLSVALMGDDMEADVFFMYHLASFIMQLEIATICYMISAFSKRSLLGVGLGVAIGMYALDIMCRIIPAIEDAKYITPFYYCSAADIFTEVAINLELVAIGCMVSVACLLVGRYKYVTKDLAS